MKTHTIQGRLGLLFLAFFLLIAISVAATFWATGTQKLDAVIINLAGRQRILGQQMTRLALEIEKEGVKDHVLELKSSANTFNETLQALKNGGAATDLSGKKINLPPARDPQLLSQLDQVGQTWGAFRVPLDVVLNSYPGEERFTVAVTSIEQISPDLMIQTNALVSLYEAAATRRIMLLRWLQFGFFSAAFLLLGIGALIMQKSVLKPLKDLGRAAERIGNGDLDTPVQISATGEIRLLADTFEETRLRLLVSQKESIAWADSLEERVNQRTRELEGLYQVSRDISSRLDIREVLSTVTQQACQLLNAEVAFLCLVDETGELLNLHASNSPAEAVVRSSAFLVDPIPSQVLAGEHALPCGVDGCHGFCGIVAAPYRVSQLVAPLRMGERVIGALCVGSSKTTAFSTEAEILLNRLANSAAVALENARLYAQAERLATLEERQRLAAEIHDGLAQTLNYLRLAVHEANAQIDSGQQAEALATLERMLRALNQAESEVRHSITSLQEDFPLYYTLQEQLAKLAEEFSLENYQIEWETTLRVPLVLPPEETEQVLRFAREALLNACRHAQARQITLRLDQDDGHARLIVEDDGQGFDPTTAPDSDGRSHFGLKILDARAVHIGGKAEISSALGKGTRVTLTWPLQTLEGSKV